MYQGVRVKITVKELLQQRRARQAATGSAVSKNTVVFALYLLFNFLGFIFTKTVISGPKFEWNRLVRRGKGTFSQSSCSSHLKE